MRLKRNALKKMEGGKSQTLSKRRQLVYNTDQGVKIIDFCRI